jgi:perosamine synthetase
MPDVPRPIAMSSPDVDESDVRAVVEVLRSGRLSLGDRVPEFERRLADYVGAPHAVAVGSGTAALHLIVRGLGLGPGNEVLVPSFTFAASVNAILYAGATPVFVDVEPDTYNLSPADLRRKAGPRCRGVMVVDLFGHPAEWDEIERVAGERGLVLIDDCCEALGAEYGGSRLGGRGAAAAFGFYPNKLITCGEGGMLVTRDPALARLAASLRNHGREAMGPLLEHRHLGYNYRMDEMSAALGLSQLLRIEERLRRRERVAALYAERLRDLDWVRPPVVRPGVRMGWFAYVVTLAEGFGREAVVRAMAADGVPARGYFPPAHLLPYLRGARPQALPVTDAAARGTVALPFHGSLTEGEVDRVVEALERARDARDGPR